MTLKKCESCGIEHVRRSAYCDRCQMEREHVQCEIVLVHSKRPCRNRATILADWEIPRDPMSLIDVRGFYRMRLCPGCVKKLRRKDRKRLSVLVRANDGKAMP